MANKLEIDIVLIGKNKDLLDRLQGAKESMTLKVNLEGANLKDLKSQAESYFSGKPIKVEFEPVKLSNLKRQIETYFNENPIKLNFQLGRALGSPSGGGNDGGRGTTGPIGTQTGGVVSPTTGNVFTRTIPGSDEQFFKAVMNYRESKSATTPIDIDQLRGNRQATQAEQEARQRSADLRSRIEQSNEASSTLVDQQIARDNFLKKQNLLSGKQGTSTARQNLRIDDELERNLFSARTSGVFNPAAQEKLFEGIATRSGSSIENVQGRYSATKAFDLTRLTKQDTLQQLAFAGLFGGVQSLGGAAIGGAAFGGPGALVGSVAGQVITRAFAENLEKVTATLEKLADAGLVFQRSILGIASVLQNNTQVFNQAGNPASLTTSLAFQQRQAEQIQLAARSRLAPIGITGEKEATLVQGITTALGQRGITANANQTSNIAERIGATVLAQRPQLLENPTLFLRDVQDVFSGGPQAQRTLLSQIIRPSLQGIINAQSAEDIDKATQSLQGFVEAVKNSDNAAVQLNRLSGAIDLLQTSAGSDFISSLTPAFKALADALGDPKLKDALTTLGKTLGTELSGVLIEGSKHISGVVGVINQLNDALAGLKLTLAAVLATVAIGGVAGGLKFAPKLGSIAGTEIVGEAALGSIIGDRIKGAVEGAISLVKKIPPQALKGGALVAISVLIGEAVATLINSAADDLYKKLEDVDNQIINDLKQKNLQIRTKPEVLFKQALGTGLFEEFTEFKTGRDKTLGSQIRRLRGVDRSTVADEDLGVFDQFQGRKELSLDEALNALAPDTFGKRGRGIDLARRRGLQSLEDLEGASSQELREGRRNIAASTEQEKTRSSFDQYDAQKQVTRGLEDYANALADAPDKLSLFTIGVEKAANALQDFATNQELRKLGRVGEFVSAGKEVLATGGSLGDIINQADVPNEALQILNDLENGGSEEEGRFKLDFAKAKLASLGITNSDERFGQSERQKQTELEVGERDAQKAAPRFLQSLNRQFEDMAENIARTGLAFENTATQTISFTDILNQAAIALENINAAGGLALGLPNAPGGTVNPNIAAGNVGGRGAANPQNQTAQAAAGETENRIIEAIRDNTARTAIDYGSMTNSVRDGASQALEQAFGG